jgi:hypothetical protein
MSDFACFSIEDGSVTGLAGGPISLADMGERTTKRASKLEFDVSSNLWTVTDPVTNEIIFSDLDYDIALAWEIRHFNEKIAAA